MDDDMTGNADERRRLLGELELERKQLTRNVETCRIRDIDRPFIGAWSLKDIVGHIASWEAEKVTAIRDLREGRRPALLDFDEANLDRWNADHVERKRDLTFWSVLDQLKAGRARLLAELDQLSDEELCAEGSLYESLVMATVEHDRAHWHGIAAKLAGMAGTRDTASRGSAHEGAH